MKKSKETLHETLNDSIGTLQNNNVGRQPLKKAETEDSTIRKPHQTSPQDTNTTDDGVINNTNIQTAAEIEKAIYGNTKPGRRQPSPQARKSALLKLTLTGFLAVLVIGLAISPSARLPWNVEHKLSEIDQKSNLTQPAEQDDTLTAEAKPVSKNVTLESPKPNSQTTNQASAQAATPTKKTAKTTTATADKGYATNQTFSWQLPTYGKITKNFGYSYDQTWQDYRFHNGVDIQMDKGEEVYACAAGKVKETAKTKALGEYIKIDYGNNIIGYYFGLTVKDTLKPGSTISKNQVLGTVTSSPLQESAYAPHYHFSLFESGQAIDPAKLMKK